MTNQYMNNLYRDLLFNSPQTITIDIPADMGTGQISQIVTKQGAVVSDWRMNYFSDMVGAFLEEHPDATVVNIACGLDTRVYRLDNGQVRWYNLDLPEVIDIRRRFLNEHAGTVSCL